MDSSIPEDYATLLEHYLNLKSNFDGIQQEFYDTRRQLKISESLTREYQGEIEILQNGDTERQQKYESKISSLEETIANLRSSHFQKVSYLETELSAKEKAIENLLDEIDILKRQNALAVALDTSDKGPDLAELLNENEKLKENYQQILEQFEEYRHQNALLENTLQEYKGEIYELKEMLSTKRDEISEKSILIDKLHDELISANKDLEVLKNKPLQDGCKGNSLFAEVDDRRVQLQKTVKDMKSSYVYLRQEYSKHEKIISHLRKENADLRSQWKKDWELIQEDHETIICTLKSRIKVLEEINERQRQQIEDQPQPSNDDPNPEYMFYQHLIDDKSAEIKQLEQKLRQRSISEHMLSVSLAQSHKKMRLLEINNSDLAAQIEEYREREQLATVNEAYSQCAKCNNEIAENENLEKSEERPKIKSCLKSIENRQDCSSVDEYYVQDETDHSNRSSFVTKRSSHFNDKKNEDALLLDENTLRTEDSNFNENIPPIKEKKGVMFSEGTVSPEAKPLQRRGRKVYVMKKKPCDDAQ